jgi:glycosyltransferase involved in cell wall biosynthesis
VGWIPVTDIVAAREVVHTPQFFDFLRREGADADVVIACHPYFTSVLCSLFPQKPLWLEAHNVEFSLKATMLPDTPAARKLLQLVHDEECLAWKRSSCVFACAQRDLDELTRIYGTASADQFVVPNGFAEEEVTFNPLNKRSALREELGQPDSQLAIFLGSWHGPNLEACELIMSTAFAMPEVKFLIVGSAGDYFRGMSIPSNVKLLGPVDEEEKRLLLAAANVALNPMRSGSGSNLKMLDYFASGVPVISTEFGARGIDAHPNVHYLPSSADDLVQALTNFFVGDNDLQNLTKRADDLARTCYSWRVIGEKALERFRHHLSYDFHA